LQIARSAGYLDGSRVLLARRPFNFFVNLAFTAISHALEAGKGISDMMDQLLNFGCTFDWITPALAFIRDFFSGPVSDFGIPTNPVWGRREIKRLLNEYEVNVWGLMYTLSGDVLLFSVKKQQAKFAYILLRRAGVPLLYVPKEAVDWVSQSSSDEIELYFDEFVFDFPE
jgi:hypothetical protein